MEKQIKPISHAVAFTRSATRNGTTSQIELCNQIAERLGARIISWHKVEGEPSTAPGAKLAVGNAVYKASITGGVRYLITADCSRLTDDLMIFAEIGRKLRPRRIALATKNEIISFENMEA